MGLVIGDDHQAVLVDSGVGQRSGRQLLQVLQQHGLRLAAILNTHGHGDHVGGNAYLVEHTGARIYAPVHDAVVLQYPLWGTLCMFGGADPLNELRTPRFAAQPCKPDVLVTEGELDVAGVKFQAVPLPGHTASHTGYVVHPLSPSGPQDAHEVFFTGDILAGDAELSNAPIAYAYSITQRLQSLEKLKGFPAARFVLGHGEMQQDALSLIDRNIAHIVRVLDLIKALLAEGPAEAGELFQALCTPLGIGVRSVKEYYLLFPTLHSFLSHLSNSGQITPVVRDNRLLWCLSG